MPDFGILAELFKVFADTTRVRLLYALTDGEKNVGELSELTQMSESAVSHQLRLLRVTKLVRTRRSGKAVYYALADEHVRLIMQMGCEHIAEEDTTNG